MAKKKKSKTPKPAKAPSLLRRWWAAQDRSAKWAIVRGVATAAVVAGVGVGGYFGLQRLRQYVMAQPAYAQSIASVELVDAPAWMNEWLAEQIRAELLDGYGDAARQTFDPALAERVGQAAANCPWVRKLHGVTVVRAAADLDDRHYAGGKVLVRAEWRKPVAEAVCVTAAGARFAEYVDDEGVVLPRTQVRLLMPRNSLGSWPMPRIVGLTQRPPAREGQAWPGAELQCALALRRRLETQPYYDLIAAIDIHNCDAYRNVGDPIDPGKPAICLYAESDRGATQISFGRLPEKQFDLGVIEPTVDRKLAMLYDFFSRGGDRPTVELRHHDYLVPTN